VYWSNWGAVSSAAASIQVQRGAGSSLYGAGSFGGSFNIVTSEVPANFGAEVRASVGSPSLFVGGASVRSGLLFDNLMSASVNYDWKQGYGSRVGSYYQGANYYANLAIYPDATSTLKFVLHAGPQEHSYSYNGPIAYFKKFGWDANPAYFLPLDVLDMKVGALTVADSLNIDQEYRTIKDAKFLSLSHNFYHKPQFEVHY
jgi:outer membrane receptor protein involved in Fe transport